MNANPFQVRESTACLTNCCTFTHSLSPIQDPAVLNVRTPNANITLDPSQVKMAPPPVMSPSYQQQPGAYAAGIPPSPTGAIGVPASTKHQHNLMDEIGESIKATNSTTIVRLMRTVNLLLAVATIVAGVLAWILGHVNSFQKVIAGTYIVYVLVFRCGEGAPRDGN
jgi:hypothetical protein